MNEGEEEAYLHISSMLAAHADVKVGAYLGLNQGTTDFHVWCPDGTKVSVEIKSSKCESSAHLEGTKTHAERKRKKFKYCARHSECIIFARKEAGVYRLFGVADLTAEGVG